MDFKPRLLSETAEIAFTEIKRFIEPRLMDKLSLRRVSAPLFLPVDSPLLDVRYPGPRIALGGCEGEVEIVGSLDVWLRGQLARYDIAPGFGVFAIMNGIRPATHGNYMVSSSYFTSWAWQQALDAGMANRKTMVATAKKLYALMVDAEKMILELFPHLNATMSRSLEVASEEELAARYPDYGVERRIYEYLHPDAAQRRDVALPDGKHCSALFLYRGNGETGMTGNIWVWNRIINRPLRIADIGIWGRDGVAGPSAGGNICRDYLAMQLLHQNRLLV